MARLILYTSGTLGDHLPYLALAQGLQARGHEVVLAINRAMLDYAQRAGVPAVALPGIERGPEEARENAWAWDHWNNPLTGAPHPKAKSQPPAEFVAQVRELNKLLDGADLLLATAIRAQGLAAHLVTAVPWLTLSVNPSAFALPPGAEARERRVFPIERAQYANLRLLLDHTMQELGRPGPPRPGTTAFYGPRTCCWAAARPSSRPTVTNSSRSAAWTRPASGCGMIRPGRPGSHQNGWKRSWRNGRCC